MAQHLLDVRDLCISFVGCDGNALEAVNKLNLHIDAGEIVGVVGESGCGKSVFAQSVMRLLSMNRRWPMRARLCLMARICWRVRSRRCARRGCDIAMIFQDPLSSLNPVMTVGAQVVEAVRAHRKVSRREARNELYRCWSVWNSRCRGSPTCIGRL
ncbi:MAG: ATP-binding cassette domain-containing protein [Collinsella sp.]